jgi:mono/diheme cytochrome c family protein
LSNIHDVKQTILSAATAALLFTGAGAAAGQTVEELGRERFLASCAVCHGEDARGGGVVAGVLTAKPADLTRLSKDNGGTFPFGRVYDTIDGRSKHIAHGSKEMPVWGKVWQAEGPYDHVETFVRGRILELIVYLRSIQQ